jgi:hypothetical protein
MSVIIEPVESDLTEPLDQDEIDRELRLVDAAISMVRRGVAHRVTLASMKLANEVLFAARARASLYNLHVRTASDVEGGPLSIIVEYRG